MKLLKRLFSCWNLISYFFLFRFSFSVFFFFLFDPTRQTDEEFFLFFFFFLELANFEPLFTVQNTEKKKEATLNCQYTLWSVNKQLWVIRKRKKKEATKIEMLFNTKRKIINSVNKILKRKSTKIQKNLGIKNFCWKKKYLTINQFNKFYFKRREGGREVGGGGGRKKQKREGSCNCVYVVNLFTAVFCSV